MNELTILPASTLHLSYAKAIADAISQAARDRGTGLALRGHGRILPCPDGTEPSGRPPAGSERIHSAERAGGILRPQH